MISSPNTRAGGNLFAFGNMYNLGNNRRINERAADTGSGLRVAFEQVGMCAADEESEVDEGDDEEEVLDA